MIVRLRERARRDDEGAVLLLAIVILGAVSLAVVTLVSQLSTHFLVTQQVNVRADQLYAADAGLHEALDGLQSEMSSNRTHCLDAAGGEQAVSSLGNFNGSALQLTCRTLTGVTGSAPTVSPLDFALITTDASKTSGSLTAQSGSVAYTIKGSMFLGGGVDVRTNSGGDIDNNLVISRGDVGQQAGACGGPTSTWASRFQTSSPYRAAPICLPYSGMQVAPTYTPPVGSYLFDPADSPVTLAGPTCKVFFPGLYATPPVLGTNNYFTSGNYYFDFPAVNATFNIASNVVFGASDPTLDPGAPPGCRTDALALAALGPGTHPERVTGTGATVILGGPSGLSVTGNVHINARTPVPANDEPVSIYGLRAADHAADSGVYVGATCMPEYGRHIGAAR